MSAPLGLNLDPLEIERANKTWHGVKISVVSVRWKPYKTDGARQMGVKGRWQELVVNGDFHRWQNCKRPDVVREE